MNAHEQEHVQTFEVEFRKLTDQIEAAMNEPTPSNGFKLRIQMEKAIIEFMSFVHCSAGAVDDANAVDLEAPLPPKDVVN